MSINLKKDHGRLRCTLEEQSLRKFKNSKKKKKGILKILIQIKKGGASKEKHRKEKDKRLIPKMANVNPNLSMIPLNVNVHKGW